jgi:hypothetical protein
MMNGNPPPPVSARNPVTAERHRREVLWQITVPLAAGVVIVLAVAAFATLGATAGAQSQMADIALVQLIIPMLFFGTISLVMLGGTVYGLARLLQAMPYFFLRVQIFFLRTQIGVHRFNDSLVAPMMKIHTFNARTRAFGRSMRRSFWFR